MAFILILVDYGTSSLYRPKPVQKHIDHFFHCSVITGVVDGLSSSTVRKLVN